MLKKLMSILLVTALLTSAVPALADGITIPPPPPPVAGEVDVGAAISPMRKGQTAPFTGVLLSPKAIATIIAELDAMNERIKIEVDKAKAEDKALCDFKLAEAKTNSDADKKILEAQVDEKQKQLTIALDQVKKMENSRPNTALWAGVGFVGGIVVTVLTVYAVSQASK